MLCLLCTILAAALAKEVEEPDANEEDAEEDAVEETALAGGSAKAKAKKAKGKTAPGGAPAVGKEEAAKKKVAKVRGSHQEFCFCERFIYGMGLATPVGVHRRLLYLCEVFSHASSEASFPFPF